MNIDFKLMRLNYLAEKLKVFKKKLKEFDKKTQGICPKTQESANSELVNAPDFCPKRKPEYIFE